MKCIIEPDEMAFHRRSAAAIADSIRKKPKLGICFATGATTRGIYQALVDLYHREGLDVSQVRAYVLDEYAGASEDHPGSCLARLKEQLFDPFQLKPSQIAHIDSTAADLNQVSKEYERSVHKAGGIDLMILGIGTNGHIGFNEPGSSFDSTTRVVQVGEDTIQSRANMFGSEDDVPKTGVTMGIKTIMNAKQIMLFAKGSSKAETLRQALLGPITQDLPASILQLHPFLTVIVDKEAASVLPARLISQ